MKNRRGFTLIELLAVIILLGIVALIAMPTVTNVIENSRMNALKSSAINILKIVTENCEEERIEGRNITKLYTISNRKLSTDLEIKNLPTSGVIRVNDKCKANVAIIEGNYCAITDGINSTVNTDTAHCEEAITP